MFYIYAYENRKTGKIYIGQTINLKKRDNAHIHNDGIKDNSLIDRKIKEYGRDNFDFWTLSIVDTKEQSDQTEIYWISEMRNQLGTKMVYNLTDGGDGLSGHKHSEKTISKISQALKGKIPSNKGKPSSEITKLKSSLSHIGQKGYWTGKKLSKEIKMKKSEAMKGKTWKMIDGKRIWFAKGEK